MIDQYKIIQGDCLEVLKQLEDNSIDAIITDPPYELGFMGKKWDNTGIAYNVDLWKECLRVLKPGGHLLAFSGTRTYHIMAVAIEDAGLEVRDMLEWIYASGFSKGNTWNAGKKRTSERLNKENDLMVENGYEGWGNSGIKPAHEPIAFCRKPIEKGLTVAQNVLKHGTGAIQIDGCRIPTQGEKLDVGGRGNHNRGEGYGFKPMGEYEIPEGQGRFPANIICTDDALNDGQMTKSGKMGPEHTRHTDGSKNGIYGKFDINHPLGKTPADSGSKSRYFDVDCWGEKHGLLQFPKASKRERNEGCEGLEIKQAKGGGGGIGDYLEDVNSASGKYGSEKAPAKNSHPCVKPVHIMSWLVRLVTKEGDTVLDPFAGSFTTGVACKMLGRNFMGIEMDANYCVIGKARMDAVKPPQPKLIP